MNGAYTRIHLSRYGAAAAVFLGVAGTSHAGSFEVKTIMENMTAEQRVPYMTGVVEGLAYARYIKDGKKTEGMKCIYDWFYNGKDSVDEVYVAFGNFPKFTPGAIIGALIQKKCGD